MTTMSKESKAKKRTPVKTLTMLIVLLAVLALVLLTWSYLSRTSSYFSLDVNPSFEVGVNRLNRVTAITPLNDDAEAVLAGYELEDKNLTSVVRTLVGELRSDGYIGTNEANDILVTAYSQNAVQQIEGAVAGIITTYLAEEGVDANVFQQNVSPDAATTDAASENGVSAGKMAVVEWLAQADETLSAEELARLSVSDLLDLLEDKDVDVDDFIIVIDIDDDDEDDDDDDDDDDIDDIDDDDGEEIDDDDDDEEEDVDDDEDDEDDENDDDEDDDDDDD